MGRGHRLIGWMSLVLALLLPGCGGKGAGRGWSPGTLQGQRIAELNLLTTPVALNLDAEAEPDGFAVKVFASGRNSPKPQRIYEGKLEILLYDGLLDVVGEEKSGLLQVWSFDAPQLPLHLTPTTIGPAYSFVLRWDAPPKRPRFSVVVRYVPPDGKPVLSAPSAIAGGMLRPAEGGGRWEE